MIVGFDYGSANCAVGKLVGDQVELLPLSANSPYVSSTLYAYDRELIALAVYQGLEASQQAEYARLRSAQLTRARQALVELDLSANEQLVFFGDEAVEQYLDFPEEGFYVRSPKSFLGASGLRQEQVALFEDIVTVMMMHIKNAAEKITKQALTQAVIGRPVNFQGVAAEEANLQAEAILTTAAKRAGFAQVAFLFEPIAAGMDYEASLTEDKTVLVVDIGGGTTDCSVVKMGPSHIGSQDRSADFLGHTGQRVGGNDLDIALAMHGFMPSLGLGSAMKNGLPVPSKPFWNAVAVNDVSAQRDFSSLASRKLIEDLIKDAQSPALINRLLKVQKQQLGYQLVRSAEQTKIALSNAATATVDLNYIETALSTQITEPQFEQAISDPINRVESLMAGVLEQTQVTPDIIYVTGGTARSPVIHQKITAMFPDKPVVVGDHFGSVTAGLARWAKRIFTHA